MFTLFSKTSQPKQGEKTLNQNKGRKHLPTNNKNSSHTVIDHNMFDIRLVVFWQPPSLRVRIVDNPRVMTATTEEAACPVIVIREAVALPVIDAGLLALMMAHPIVELANKMLAVVHVAFLLV